MITEDYVSFKIAKLLKAKGFDAATFHDYDERGIRWSEEVLVNHNSQGGIACPTLQMAMKWLREIHQLHIGILVVYNYIPRRYRYHIMHTENVETYSQNDFDTYEEACEAAIKYCLENLI